MNQKERLLRALRNAPLDRPPVICPGGMMSACVTEILENIAGNHHTDPFVMSEAAKQVYELTGFENYGVPFCLTAEAEQLGVQIDLGDYLIEPRVTAYNENEIEVIMAKHQVSFTDGNRMGAVLKAIRLLKNEEVPVIGNIGGHISTATSVVDPLVILKMLKREPERVNRFFRYINDYLISYAREMIEAGADVIALSDPTATGEILGSKHFETFALPFYKQLAEVIHSYGIPVIVHICGKAQNIIEGLNSVGAEAVSFDSVVNMGSARTRLNTALMGNVNTQLLHTGAVDKIISSTGHAIKSGVDIVAPACGLSMATPLVNLRAMTEYVKQGHYN